MPCLYNVLYHSWHIILFPRQDRLMFFLVKKLSRPFISISEHTCIVLCCAFQTNLTNTCPIIISFQSHRIKTFDDITKTEIIFIYSQNGNMQHIITSYSFFSVIEILILSLSLFISSGNMYYRKYEDSGILESQMETISPF